MKHVHAGKSGADDHDILLFHFSAGLFRPMAFIYVS
jgi:hypothetical protein